MSPLEKTNDYRSTLAPTGNFKSVHQNMMPNELAVFSWLDILDQNNLGEQRHGGISIAGTAMQCLFCVSCRSLFRITGGRDLANDTNLTNIRSNSNGIAAKYVGFSNRSGAPGYHPTSATNPLQKGSYKMGLDIHLTPLQSA